ncbi:hypothetical protein AgCh_036607 [Apium graveolens]
MTYGLGFAALPATLVHNGRYAQPSILSSPDRPGPVATAIGDWDRRILQNRDALLRLEGYWVLIVEQTETPSQLDLQRKEQVDVAKIGPTVDVASGTPADVAM